MNPPGQRLYSHPTLYSLVSFCIPGGCFLVSFCYSSAKCTFGGGLLDLQTTEGQRRGRAGLLNCVWLRPLQETHQSSQVAILEDSWKYRHRQIQWGFSLTWITSYGLYRYMDLLTELWMNCLCAVSVDRTFFLFSLLPYLFQVRDKVLKQIGKPDDQEISNCRKMTTTP